MNIGLCDVDSKIPNVALMKLSTWHKQRGDRVSWFDPLWGEYDRVYASKVFDFTADNPYLPNSTIRGGTGYNLDPLPAPDTTYPDYSLYGIDYAIGRITRGCIRRCPFCMVWKQDGKVRQVAQLEDFWNGQTRLLLLDDNLMAIRDLFLDTCYQLHLAKVRVSWAALDIRLMDEDLAFALMLVRRWGSLHFAWDNVATERQTLRGLKCLKRVYPSLHDVLVYVLIGYDSTPEEDLYRVEKLRDLGAMPFVMPFDKRDTYQRRFARWANHKAIFRSVPWQDYRLGIGHGKGGASC